MNNKLSPENLIFVPKNRISHFLLSCLTSFIVLLLGFLITLTIYFFNSNK